MPSSFALYMTLLAFGGWFNKEYPIAILAIAAAAILGWPFAAALGLVQKSRNIILSCLVIHQPLVSSSYETQLMVQSLPLYGVSVS